MMIIFRSIQTCTKALISGLTLAAVTVFLNGCGSEKIEVESSVDTEVESHYVLLNLPNVAAATKAKVTLALEGRTPQVQVFEPDLLAEGEDYRAIRFEVGKTVKPGTLTIEYASGEKQVLSQVVFDTLLTARPFAE